MLTRESDHTIRIVHYLASPDNLQGGSTAQIIHNALGIPNVVLRGILHRLAVAGVVHSKRGRTGGVTLDEGALKLSVLEILNTVNPANARCCGQECCADDGQKKDDGQECRADEKKDGDPVRELFAKARAKVLEVLGGVTLGGLAAQARD